MRRHDREEWPSSSRSGWKSTTRYPHLAPDDISFPPYTRAYDDSRRTRASRRRWPPPPSVEDEATSLAREFGGLSLLEHTEDEACMRGEIDQETLLEDVDVDSDNQNPERRFVLVNDPKGKTSRSDRRDGTGHDRGEPKGRTFLDPDQGAVPVYARREPSPYTIWKPENRLSGDYTDVPNVPPSTRPQQTERPFTRGRRGTNEGDFGSEPAPRRRASPRPSSGHSSTTKDSSPRRQGTTGNIKTAAGHLRNQSLQSTPPASPGPRDEAWDPFFTTQRSKPRQSSRPTTPSAADGRSANASAPFPPRVDTNEPSQRLQVSTGSMSSSRSDVPPAIPPARTETNPPYPTGAGIPLPYPVDDMPSLMPELERFTSPTEITGPQFTPGPATTMPISTNQTNQYLSEPASRPAGLVPAGTTPPRSPQVESTPQFPTEPKRTEPRLSIQPALASLARCPRGEFTSRYDDWYMLDGYPHFDVCPSCLDLIIKRTKPDLLRYFVRAPRRSSGTQVRCDFNNPWVRLAWILTLRSSRTKIDLIDRVAHIYDHEERCPAESEVLGPWYGLLHEERLISEFYFCPIDRKVLEALFPSLRGQFARLSQSDPPRRRCATRVTGRRYPALIDVFADIEAKASGRNSTANLKPLVELLRSPSPPIPTPSTAPTTSNPSQPATARPPATPDTPLKCMRDHLVLNHPWHLIPALPELTVCPACYTDVVRPHLLAGSRLAERFTRTPLLLSDDPPPAARAAFGAAPPPAGAIGHSCQLYSPRMRRVWSKAVAGGDDFEYLAKRARERKKAEMALQGQHAALRRLMEERLGATGSARLAEERFEREWKEILREWKEWE